MKKQIFCILIALIIAFNGNAQNELTENIGIYGDWMPNGKALVTELELKLDGTFKLRTVDYIYPQKFKDFFNEGKWVSNGNEITLNPHLKRRHPKISVTEKKIALSDSIEIKINHFVELYENQELVEKKIADFEILTIYFDKPRKDINILREPYIRKCGFAPKVKHQKIVDSKNIIRVAKRDFEKLGFYTNGFNKPIEIKLQNQSANYFEIDIVVPIDKERMPRNKKVIIKGNKAYFYEIQGKVNTFWLEPLRKKST